MRELGTDYLDLYLMHWPVAFSNPKNSELSSLKSQDGRPIENHILSADIMKTWRNLEEMVKKGKVRNIGISNFNIRRVEELLASAEILPATNQVEVNYGVPNDELLHYCEAHQIKIQAYSPLGSSEYVEEYSQDPIIQDVAQRNNMTPTQVVLAWHLARGINPITRSRNVDRMQEALAATELELPWPDVQHLLKEAENKPIQRVVDPTVAWNVKEDIFEDGTDQTRLLSLKTDSIEVSMPHEANASSSSGNSHYLEPRNAPDSENKPNETVARFHTLCGGRTSGTRGSTVIQQLMHRRGFSSSRVPRATSSFLSSTSKQALATPGLQWSSASAQAGESRETRKMNMCTVRPHASGTQTRCASSVASPLASSSGLPPVPSAMPQSSSSRVYTPRKAFLFSQYSRLLSESQFMLLVQPNNLSVAELSAIRAEIAAVPLPEGEDAGNRARLTVVRSGVMKPVLRQAIRDRSSTNAELGGLESILSGPLAMLTCPSLSPPYVSRLLSVIDKALGNRALSPAAAAGKPHTRTASANPRMVPLAAIVEGNRLVDVPALRDVSKLPDLQTLRSQIVGLLSSPASQLASVLSMASGGQLSLTLEGRKRQLEEKAQ